MKIAISAESTIDLTKELLEKFNIKTAPFTVLLGDEQHLDGEFDTKEIFDYVKRTKVLPKTSAVNEFQYENHFKELLKDNDAVVHFSLSSDLSSAYNNAVNVARKFKNVYVVDTKTLSTGIALLAIYARKLADEGVEPEEIAKKCGARVKSLQVSFVLNRLDYLYKGGRCNAMMYFGANLLKLKPKIVVENGKMDSAKKYRGKNDAVVINYVEDTLQEFNNYDKENVFITYTTANPEILDKVENILKSKGFKNVYQTIAGATITSHCGEDCLGILYLNDGGEK